MTRQPAWMAALERYKDDGRLKMKAYEDRSARAILGGLGISNAEKRMRDVEIAAFGTAYQDQPLIERAMRYMQHVYASGEGLRPFDGAPEIMFVTRTPTAEMLGTALEAKADGTDLMYAWDCGEVLVDWLLDYQTLEKAMRTGTIERVPDNFMLTKNLADPGTRCFQARQTLRSFFSQGGPYAA